MVVEHDVLRLQVSVDDALLVQVAQSHGDLCQVETTEKDKEKKYKYNELQANK